MHNHPRGDQLVTLQPEAPNPITIDNGGQWVDVAPQCNARAAPRRRAAGAAPSREEMVKRLGSNRRRVCGSGERFVA